MNTGFSRLQVQGFRRLRDLDLELKPLNVLIGANGVGKTSILEVMRLLAESAEGRLQETITASGGFKSLLTNDRTDPMRLMLSMPVAKQEPLEYELNVRLLDNGGYSVFLEHLIQERYKPGAKAPYFKYIESHGQNICFFDHDSGKLIQPTWNHNLSETSLAQVPRMFQEPENFRKLLASSTLYHALDVLPRSPVRLPQPMRPDLFPGQNGENLVSCLYFLRETEPDRFETIEDTLRVAFPNFESMSFPPAAAGLLSLAWRERPYSQPMYAYQLSEGTLRFLWLLTLLQSPNLPTVTLIDEPEVSLHPEMLRLLAALFREAAMRTQLIVATHSDRLVRFLDPSELVVCDLDESGGTTATRASDMELDVWLDEYSLDELWGMGRLGGRM
jgi:predicted ATPase